MWPYISIRQTVANPCTVVNLQWGSAVHYGVPLFPFTQSIVRLVGMRHTYEYGSFLC